MKIINTLGLSFDFLKNGSIQFIEAEPIRISLKPATIYSKAGANIYLRKRNDSIKFKALLGPESNSVFCIKESAFIAKGSLDGLDYVCKLQLSPESTSWQWTIDLFNSSGIPTELDLILVQDVGMKPISSGLVNEYYVSQYLERLILNDRTFGPVVCCRQNTKESVGNPWLLLACKNKAASASTDGMQFLGKKFRENGIPQGLLNDALGGEYTGELSMVALQEKPFSLLPGQSHKSVFVASYIANHPAATSKDDLELIPKLLMEFQNEVSIEETDKFISPVTNIFNTAPYLQVDDLTEDELNHFFTKEKRHEEKEREN